MKSRLLPNGLSRRTNRCLALAGIPINKRVIIRALKSGKLYPFHWPPNYGQFTHFEVCDWAGIDRHTLPPEPPRKGDVIIFPDIGISHRACDVSSVPAFQPPNKPPATLFGLGCLCLASVPATTAHKRTPNFAAGRALIPHRC